MLHRPLVFHPASVMTNQTKSPEHQMPASEGGPARMMNAVRSITGKQPSLIVAPAPPRDNRERSSEQ